MGEYKERKKINILTIILAIILMLATVLFIVSLYSYFKKTYNNDVEKFYGTYELSIDNFSNYGDDITGKKIIDINKENIVKDQFITSGKYNFIEFDNIEAVLIYFNDIAITNSQDQNRIDETGFMKFCFTKNKNLLIQIDCPNIINEQNLGISIKNEFIEYKKKTN